MTTSDDSETPQPLLNLSRLSLRDYTLLTDITKVLSDCPSPLTLSEVCGKFQRLEIEALPVALEAIFRAVDKQREGKVAGKAFARHYCFSVQQMSEDAFALRQKAEELQERIAALKEQIHNPDSVETLNSWGIAESSVLKVTIGRVTGIQPPKPCSLVVICERQRQVTNTLMSNFVDGWEEQLEFRVTTGAGDVLFSLVTETEILGQCAVAIPTLRDQKLHEAWVDMVSSSRSSHIKLHLSLQWLHNLRLHLRDQVEQETLAITDALQKNREMEARLKDLGMRWDEDWTETLMRKMHVALECVRHSNCSSQCLAM